MNLDQFYECPKFILDSNKEVLHFEIILKCTMMFAWRAFNLIIGLG